MRSKRSTCLGLLSWLGFPGRARAGAQLLGLRGTVEAQLSQALGRDDLAAVSHSPELPAQLHSHALVHTTLWGAG